MNDNKDDLTIKNSFTVTGPVFMDGMCIHTNGIYSKCKQDFSKLNEFSQTILTFPYIFIVTENITDMVPNDL